MASTSGPATVTSGDVSGPSVDVRTALSTAPSEKPDIPDLSGPITSSSSFAPHSALPSSISLAAHGPSATETTLVPPRQTTDTTTIPESSIPNDDAVEPVPSAGATSFSSTSKPKSLSITLLLISSVRYPFVINADYMSRHNIQVQDHDPMQMGVYALKECIWKEWKDEWDTKPPSANFIRLIHFGRLLDDRQQLKDCRLNPDTPNVVHMTIRPAETGDDEMTQRSQKVFGRSDREHREGPSPHCRCVIL